MRVIEARELTKVYGRGENRVEALTGINMNVEPGEWIAIMGPSGSGKSTLMNLIGLLDRPTSGFYKLNGRDVSRLRGQTRKPRHVQWYSNGVGTSAHRCRVRNP
jgi:putative ABC transport system ATP-binding protein